MSVLSDLRRRALTKGLFGGSRVWLFLGIAAWSVRALKWALRPDPKTVYKGRLLVGETVVLTHEPAAPTRRKRRKAKKAERRSRSKPEPLSGRA
jgi:hypothetical protein